MRTEDRELIEYINEKGYTNLLVIKKTNISLGQKEFRCEVDWKLDFEYVMLYVESIKLWLCWKKREGRIQIYNAQQEDVLQQNIEDYGFFIKNKEFSGHGQEKVYIIRPNKVKEFVDKLSKNEIAI